MRENRIAVIALHKCKKDPKAIFNLLKPLGISLRFVYRTIKRFIHLSSVDDKARSGRPRSVRTPDVIKKVRERIRRNPVRKQKIMAQQLQMSRMSVSRLLNQDLGLRAYRRCTGHLLNTRLKKIRLERSRNLLRRHAKNQHRRILFSDEKIFTIEQKFNRQNDRVYARSREESRQVAPRVLRGHHPASVMVWLGVSYQGATEVHFCEKGVKTSANVYVEEVLEKVVKPLNQTMFTGDHWIFQQDSAPAHKARKTQQWLKDNVPEFISHMDWPSSSPDLNPLDYKLWDILETKTSSSSHSNLENLKKSLRRAVADLDINVIRAAIDDWPRRLKACVKAKGGHFE